jgi:hypothetical protein
MPETESIPAKLPRSGSSTGAEPLSPEATSVSSQAQEPYQTESEPPASNPPQEHAPMIEIHSPHEPVHSWKDAFIHIAIIVVGLVIAVGLEQTVEFVHHRFQVAETRRALLIERRVNINHFAMQTEEFHRFVPKLETDLAIFQFLKAHPHAPPDQWPGKISRYHMMSRYIDAAWKTAQENNVLALMPDQEVQQDDQLYRQLAGLSDNMAAKEDAFYENGKLAIQAPDPAQMSPQQVQNEIEGYTNVLMLYARAAIDQRVLSLHFPDFKPTTTYEDELKVLHARGGHDDDIRVMDEMTERLRREDERVTHDEER